MALPAGTGSGDAVFWTETSALCTTGVLMVDELLARLGSGVVEVTLAVLVTEPVVLGSVTTSADTVKVAPAGMVPRSQVPTPAIRLQDPPVVEASMIVTPAGMGSVKVTPWASDGPALWMMTV